MYNGVKPFCERQLTLALNLINNLTTSSWPAKLAICKAVFPFFNK